MTFNQWWLSLPKGRRDVLIEDKWRLAEAAFDAGVALTRTVYVLVNYDDGSTYGVFKTAERAEEEKKKLHDNGYFGELIVHEDELEE